MTYYIYKFQPDGETFKADTAEIKPQDQSIYCEVKKDGKSKWYNLDQATPKELYILFKSYYSQTTPVYDREVAAANNKYLQLSKEREQKLKENIQLNAEVCKQQVLLFAEIEAFNKRWERRLKENIFAQVDDYSDIKVMSHDVDIQRLKEIIIGLQNSQLKQELQKILDLKENIEKNKKEKKPKINGLQVNIEAINKGLARANSQIPVVNPKALLKEIKRRLTENHSGIAQITGQLVKGLKNGVKKIADTITLEQTQAKKQPKLQQTTLELSEQRHHLLNFFNYSKINIIRFLPMVKDLKIVDQSTYFTKTAEYNQREGKLLNKLFATILMLYRRLAFNIDQKTPEFMRWFIRLFYNREKYLQHESRSFVKALLNDKKDQGFLDKTISRIAN
jgi:hypothetical protein